MNRLLAAIKVLVVVGVLGGLIAASGIVPIKASSRHWLVTVWLLEFSKRRSVSTHTLGVSVPELTDQDAFKAAAHYEIACRACHGSPGSPQPTIAFHMTPRPPNLAESVPKYDPEELFYIVKHGIKFTGMPAWPTQLRDDEVWAMTAFLRRYPDLDQPLYEQLVRGRLGDLTVEPMQTLDPGAIPEAVVRTCARCHDTDGSGRGGVFPALAGQKPDYLAASLQAYKHGERHSGLMEPIAAALTDAEIDELAAYFANLSSAPTNLVLAADKDAPAPEPNQASSGEREEATFAEAIKRGRQIAELGLPAQGVPACIDCHGQGGEGGADLAATNRHYPILAGQSADYLALQLILFKEGRRGGTPYAHLMDFVAGGLTEEQMRDVAAYFESLAAAGDRGGAHSPE